MKKRMWVLIVLLVALILFGCVPAENKQEVDTKGSDAVPTIPEVTPSEIKTKDISELKIAFLGAGSNTFGVKLKEAADSKASELGLTLDYYLANMDLPTQIAQIEACVSNEYDAIILQPANSTGIDDSINSVMEAGIPLILVNMKGSTTNYTCYVGSDNIDSGRMQGEWLRSNGGDGLKIGYITVTMGTSTQIDRFKGFKEAFLVNNEDAVVLAYGESKAQRDIGMNIMEDWLQAYPEMNCVVCQNDSAALGAMQAIMAAKKEGQILLLGIDAEKDAVQGIVDGTFTMTVFQDAFGQGSRSVEVAAGIAIGQSYDKDIEIPFIPVDKTNAVEFLK